MTPAHRARIAETHLRRCPHCGKHPPLPGFAELVARVRPLMEAHPLRSRWKDGGS